MSAARARRQRGVPRSRGANGPSDAGALRLGLIGTDVSRVALGRSWSKRVLLVVLAGAAALLLAVLRNEILRTRYRLAQVAQEERALLEERRQILVEVRRLRDPERLTRVAGERGFAPPARLIDVGPADGSEAGIAQ